MTLTEKPQMFSQEDEETHILAHTPETGHFLDIGAWHPEDLSNTRALYLRGWSGVCVDPAPAAIAALLKAYGDDPRMCVVPAMVGQDRGLRELRVSDGPYSTAHSEAAERFSDLAAYHGTLWVPQLTIPDLIDRWGPFHFVNIDIEGGSVDLLAALLAIPMQPPCICVEHDGRYIDAVKMAESAGYRLVAGNGTNLIFATGAIVQSC